MREEFADTLEELREEQRKVVECYRPLVEKLNRRMARELEPVNRRSREARQQIEARLGELDPALPDYPEGSFEDDEPDTYLFDSGRAYFEQMGYYRRHQGREGEWYAVVVALGGIHTELVE